MQKEVIPFSECNGLDFRVSGILPQMSCPETDSGMCEDKSTSPYVFIFEFLIAKSDSCPYHL